MALLSPVNAQGPHRADFSPLSGCGVKGSRGLQLGRVLETEVRPGVVLPLLPRALSGSRLSTRTCSPSYRAATATLRRRPKLMATSRSMARARRTSVPRVRFWPGLFSIRERFGGLMPARLASSAWLNRQRTRSRAISEPTRSAFALPRQGAGARVAHLSLEVAVPVRGLLPILLLHVGSSSVRR